MGFSNRQERLIWSATPTPFLKGEVDAVAVEKMIEQHFRSGVAGIFLAGTCGEGPWMREQHFRDLLRMSVQATAGRFPLAANITSNSAEQALDKARVAQEAGVDLVIISGPFFLINATPENLLRFYLKVVEASPLPVGFYDLGKHQRYFLPEAQLKEIYQHPKIKWVKDSSGDPVRQKIALQARDSRPDLRLMNGNEFDCVNYLKSGYDGLMLGGAIFNAPMARRLIEALEDANEVLAEEIQNRMNELMWAVYGSKNLHCWLTGLKYLLIKMGIFSTTESFLNYPLNEETKSAIDQIFEEDPEKYFPDLYPQAVESL